MAESSRRFRKSTSRSIAATSAIALALGGLSVVGPGPLAPHAAAETLSGGIRDKSGAVEEDAQQASDLPAGSCVVKSDEPNGSQAGFSWNNLEPSGTSPDKTLWGLSVSFDNSKDRTFADWYFSNSGPLSSVLDTGEVPSMEAGQTFIDKDVTRKADESIEISASGRSLRNLNLYAELTDEKVKQFASASADNPVRYAWQSNYKQENPVGSRATLGDTASFGATVNPWPSENIECNPITVSWETAEVSENHVIVPGEETKVGTINVPALQNSGTDDSMSRMVVEAYDGNGKFIGTTDPEASGGEQLLRIDEATGDIYFTWPEYRGTDLATDKNVNFSVLAKPRDVDQLQSAAKHNNEFGEEMAFDSSNSLTRYNKANVIDSTSFSLDDTEYHDPKYDKTDASIISGVDSATGPLATEAQKVTFNQVPDLIKDLEKKKGDGGFEAKVTLDEKYVYEGWTVEMDEDYNVTVTAPENPRPGTFARPVVTVEYSNGSTDELELLVVVDPNNTQVTDLVRPRLTKGIIGDDLTAQIGTKSIMKGHKPVHPAKFEVDPSTVPDGWTVTVDETGKVTAKADDTVAPGTIITPTVKATYPDETTDEIETQFQAIVDIKIPNYDTVANKPNAKVSLTPEIPERGLSGNTTDEAPKRYTFEGGKTEYTHTDDSGTWTVKIDENTGEITTTIPRTAPEGYILNVPVLAYYDNADKPQQVNGTVVVLKSDISPTYDVQVTGPNKAVEHHVQDAPKGSKFSFGADDNGEPITEQVVDGWKYKVDPNTGVVTSTPPADAKPGDQNTVTVTVTAPDGATPKVPVTTVVKLTNNWEAEPTVPAETVFPGGTATSPITVEKPEGINLAETPYAIKPAENFTPTGETNEFGNPTYKVVTDNGDWIVGLDKDGNVISTAPETAQPGDTIDVPVTVTYEDGSEDTTTAVVTVEDFPERPKPFDVEYKYDPSIPAGEYKVETEGVPGTEKMALDENGDETWNETKAPVNEVVLIGTKQATATEKVEWTEPIPYSTVVRSNPELKPGEVKTVQDGRDGEASYAATFSGTNGEAKVEETKDRTEPVEEIIEYGPGIQDQTLTNTTTNPVPFNTKFVADDTLAAGEQVVEKQGVNGVDTITSTQEIKDGKPVGKPTIATERTTEPQDAVIRVGTKTTGETSETVTSEVPFDVKVEFDPNMPAGTSETVTEGKPGKKTVTIKRDVTNSTPGEPTISEEVTEDPVDQVIKVGTKLSEASEKVTWTAQVPFEVETRPNPELKPGEVKVVQKGEPGEKTYSADFSAKGDQATVTPEEKQIKDPVKHIIEYGPAPEDTSVVTKVEKPVPFETEIVFDDTLAEGEQVVDQQGELGTEVVTSTQQIVDGKPSGDPVVNTERTAEPVQQVIRVGTKTTGQTVNSVEAEIPFPTRVVYDPTLAPGETKVTQEGKPGTKKVTITQPVVNSAPNGEATVAEETVTEPTEQIVTVGTKPDEATNTVKWTVDVPFKTVVRPNPDLKPGEVKTVQEGEYGEKTFTADFSSVGADSKADTKEEQTKEPKDQIIEYGPTIDDQTLTSETTRPVEFETEFIPDDTLAAGEQKVDQQGEIGEEKITSTQEIKDGKPVGEPTITTEVTKPVKKAIIRVGTKPTTTTATTTATTTEKSTATETTRVEVPTTITTTLTSTEKVPTTVSGTPTTITETKEVPTTITTQVPTTVPTTVKETQVQTSTVTPAPVTTTVTNDPEPVNVSETVTLPYTTKIVFDPTLEPGQEVEKVAGVNGEVKVTVTNGTSTVETVKEPVQRVVRVGSKPDNATEWTEETPFEVQVVVDPELEAGKYETVQEGKPGQIVHRTDGTEDITPAVDHIIKVGTKKVITNPFEFSTLQPFSTTVRPNFDLKPGERKVIQEGVNGVVRYRIDMTTGEVAKLDESQAVDRIVEYGPAESDNEAVTKVTRPVPFDTEIIEDPNLPAGTQAFEQGEVGEEVVTTTQPIKDGKPYGDPVTTTEQTKAPRNAIIRVGTKTPATPQPLPEFSETVELPYTTKIVWDPTLEPGQEIEDVAGENGLVEARVTDGKLTLETVKEPVQRVVRVGSKPADGAEWTEQIPFQVQVRQNPELSQGESRVIQNGVAGLKRYVDGVGEVVSEPVDYILEIGTKDLTEQPTYSAVALRAGQSAEVALSSGHVQGNSYRKLDWPEGWEGSVDPKTGQIRVTPPADAEPGTKVSLPVEVTDANGNTLTVNAEVAVFGSSDATPTPTPPADDDADEDKGSSDKARRCLANAFAANSPFLWLLPLGILGAVGYGVNEAFGPQIQQVSAQFDEAVRPNLPDFGVGHGVEKPEVVREIEGQINAINQRFAPVAQQLEPVGIALGAIALLSVTGVLVAQACSEDGFDNGLSVLGSSQDGAAQQETAASSRK